MHSTAVAVGRVGGGGGGGIRGVVSMGKRGTGVGEGGEGQGNNSLRGHFL